MPKLTAKVMAASDAAIQQAADILKTGGIVAIPTETVYGIAANALDGVAVAKIFAAKGRPQFNPIIVHCASTEEAARYVVMNDTARILAQRFWPGPITFILPRAEPCAISELVSAGLPSLAVRVPVHPVTRKLIEVAGVPLAAPSANISGTLSPTTPAHVVESLGDKLDMILAAGPTTFGLESTVLDLTGDVPLILRPGAITKDDLEMTLGCEVRNDFEPSADLNLRPKSPGQLLRHYAPSTKVRLNAVDIAPGEALLAFGSIRFMAVRGVGSVRDLPDTSFKNLSEQGDLNEAAANLFSMLRELDRPEHKTIAIMSIPNTGLGVAINDRLKRAAASGKVAPGVIKA
jgi:L-threonylcarbamoyladenylate synthase